MPSHIFVLTGAGVSAESGLGTFRDKNSEGIWAKFDLMKLATPEAFARNPSEVLAFYDVRRRNPATPGPTRRISRWRGSKLRSPSAAVVLGL
jgi:NAD-dependent SIR2 family protein deacetylase